jgi:hypothetical protein
VNNYKQYLKQNGWPLGGAWSEDQLDSLLDKLGQNHEPFLTLAARDAIRWLRADPSR